MNSPAEKPPATGRNLRRAGLVIVPVAAAVLAIGIVPRLRANEHVASISRESAVPVVQTIAPKPAPPTEDLTLPGSVAPFQDASIYARTSGYIAHWYVDIGARVKAGTLLATIAAPELDAQLREAKAAVEQAQASYQIASTTAQRWQTLLATQSVSQQETDLKVSDMQQKRAALDQAQASVARLTELQSYENVVAPFDGVITARRIDVGALVDAGGTGGGASTPASELFHMQQTQALRVYVQVPQSDAALVSQGTSAYLETPEHPGARIAATVTRTNDSITPSNRTLLAEIDVDNRDGALIPGAYAQVHLQLKPATPGFQLPVNALLFRASGVTVAVAEPTAIGSSGASTSGAEQAEHVELRTVTIRRDFGTYVELASGLKGDERVILNPGDSIYAGARVQVAADPAGGRS